MEGTGVRDSWAQELGDRLQECFQPVVVEARTAYPALHGGFYCRAPLGLKRFIAHAWFMYDPAHAESEDLLLSFECLPATFVRCARDLQIDPEGHDFLRFEIERGTGLVLASLDPLVLPWDEDAPEYRQALLGYAEQVCAFVDERTELILDALRTPYLS